MAYLLLYVYLSVFIFAFLLDFSCSVFGPFRFMSDMSWHVCVPFVLCILIFTQLSLPTRQHLWQCKPMTVIYYNEHPINIVIINNNYQFQYYSNMYIYINHWTDQPREFSVTAEESPRSESLPQADAAQPVVPPDAAGLVWKTNKQLFGKQTNII